VKCFIQIILSKAFYGFHKFFLFRKLPQKFFADPPENTIPIVSGEPPHFMPEKFLDIGHRKDGTSI